MKVFIDNRITRLLSHHPEEVVKHSALSNLDTPISFGWPTLLEWLEWGSLFRELPSFDPIFNALIVTLHSHDDEELVFHLYDKLFTEWLQQIKNLPQINSASLLQAIKSQRTSSIHFETLIKPTLVFYEQLFTEKSLTAMHDVVLYLAWDRMYRCG